VESFHWCGAIGLRDSRRLAETLPELEGSPGLWYVCHTIVLRLGLIAKGLTETCTVVCSTSPDDIWFGSSGSLLPGIECKIVTTDGVEVTGYDQPGELLVKSPAVVLGYLNNDKANKETFQNGYMLTGDEAVIRKAPSGHEHVFIVDRIKELIKVKVGLSFLLIL
jgi:long-subunit acyl-CoA synthetase (AMP-forming)